MRPILLKGHERPISKVKYNREGDLLFSCGKDKIATVWYAHNGERLGTYDGHDGSVWDCDVNWDTTLLATASSDRTLRIWEVETGKEIAKIDHKASVRSVNFAHGGVFLACTQDNSFKQTPTIFIYDMPKFDDEKDEDEEDEEEEDSRKSKSRKQKSKRSEGFGEPIRSLFEEKGTSGKICDALWGPLNLFIVAGYDDGSVRKWDVEAGKEVERKREHSRSINSIQFSKDQTMFITASSDQTARLWDTKTMTCLKTYHSNRPLNAAAISPLMKHIIVGGGQEAINVTQTLHKSGHFEVDFHHLVYQDLYGVVKGHFGPVHTLAFSPDGKGYASGSEDGYVRLHHFPASYFKNEDDKL